MNERVLPAPGGPGRDAGKSLIALDHHSQEGGGIKSIDEVAVDYAARVLESERQFVAAGWFDPVGLHNAGHKHGLHGDRFGDPLLGCLYAYLATCAELGVEPSVDGCIGVARAQRISLTSDWLFTVILETDIESNHVEQYGAQVARLADYRERAARHHLAEVAGLLIDLDRFEVVIRERRCGQPGAIVPRRLRRRGRHVA